MSRAPSRSALDHDDETLDRLLRYADTAPAMALDTDAVLTDARRHVVRRRTRGAVAASLTVAALAVAGTHLVGLDRVHDDARTADVAVDAATLSLATGITAAAHPVAVDGDPGTLDLGLDFPDLAAGEAITLTADGDALVVVLPLEPGSEATGATEVEVRLTPWTDPADATGTWRTLTSTDGRAMLVLGTVPQWVAGPTVTLTDPLGDGGFALRADGSVPGMDVPTFDTPGTGTGRAFAAVISAESEISKVRADRMDAVPLLPVVTGVDRERVFGGPCGGDRVGLVCARDVVQGKVDMLDAATVQPATGVTATARLGVSMLTDLPRDPARDILALDLGIGVTTSDGTRRTLAVLPPGSVALDVAGSGPGPVSSVALGLAHDEVPTVPLLAHDWVGATGVAGLDEAVDMVSTVTQYTAVGSSWVLTGTVPGAVAPDSLARIELSGPVTRADGSVGTSIDVPTFEVAGAGDGRRIFVVVLDESSGLPGPATGRPPLADGVTTFVGPAR
jgi:hypothetical protein